MGIGKGRKHNFEPMDEEKQSNFDSMMNVVNNEIDTKKAEDELVSRVPELKRLSDEIDKATTAVINAKLSLETAIRQTQREEGELGAAIHTISEKVDSINKRIDKVMEDAPKKLNVSIHATDADMKKIDELFAKHRQWVIEQNLKHYREIMDKFAEERKEVRDRFKEYDGTYLGYYIQYFVWFFFTIGIFTVAGIIFSLASK